jgi:hypothetical protein
VKYVYVYLAGVIMPKGRGTYGSAVGRPKKKKRGKKKK